MTALNATAARRNLYQLIAEVNENRSPVIITNTRGKNAVLLRGGLERCTGNALPERHPRYDREHSRR